MKVINGTIIDTMNGIINDIRYKKLENFIPYAIRNFIIVIICIIQAKPVRIINNMMKIVNNCRLKYLFIIFIDLSIKPKSAPVKNNSIFTGDIQNYKKSQKYHLHMALFFDKIASSGSVFLMGYPNPKASSVHIYDMDEKSPMYGWRVAEYKE